ncbi:type II toxin-antitoxin system PemK/MazF family toxin [Nocardioides sp. zg-DK7169]|uniref:type II toxin-antitoxin system PemK/MazF family toxin n=1 Tax=Nocardioides sp. zg-DK7169 TaxID=2736600 RepID=UPI001554D5BE|nr:type II toxin-antitoxin system PemK/MazF family toxin [Nocardioides sp. zg-DK7169]NPC97995.1 type II toxin-antitoxin system PemK/MazF family toxin [Nocardioides sp. zg-DK7169]
MALPRMPRRLARLAGRGLRTALTPPSRRTTGAPRTSAPAPPRAPGRGSVRDEIGYAPRPDGRPDPGEVVWGWVPYEEDATRGKDCPVLVIGRRGPRLLGLMLTSKDHDRDAADEARWGRYWMDVGTGAWDGRGRPSEVRLDRLLVLEESSVRREGAALDRRTFDAVLAAARPHLS